MQIPFVGGAYTSRSTNHNAQACINLYPVIDQTGAKSVIALYSIPGCKEVITLNTGMEFRGLHKSADGFLYAVVGNSVYRMKNDFSYEVATGSLDKNTGIVLMEDNGAVGNQLMIVEPNNAGYICTLGASPVLTKIEEESFPVPSSLTYQDGYFIVGEFNTQKFQISGSYDGTTWDATDFASFEGSTDNLLALISDHRELWAFGTETTEVWYNSGAADFPFERTPGIYIEHGILAPLSVAKLDNSVFWLGDKKQIFRADGYTPAIISTSHIDYQISTYDTVEDAIAFAYTQEGHSFYCITFPSASKTWVYDAATGFWHERSTGPQNEDGTHNRWRANCYVYFAGKHLIGDFNKGNLYELSFDHYKDGDIELTRTRAAQVIHKDRKRLFFHRFEIDFESGVGLSVNDADIGSGTNPQAMLSWSDDGGHTWSQEYWSSLGATGTYQTSAYWQALGSSQERIFKVNISDPVKVVILNAHLSSSVGVYAV